MRPGQTVPPLETWTGHLTSLDDSQLAELAGDYCWLMEKNRPEDQRAEFQKRREAILAECERRGLQEAAGNCRPSAPSIEEKEES